MSEEYTNHEYTPAGWHAVTPRIFVSDPMACVAFLKDVFDGVGDYQSDRPSEIRVGDSIIMVSGEEARGSMNAFLYVYVPDSDSVYDRAIEADSQSIEAPFDTPYGDRRAMVEDPWGNTWQIATRLGDS